jgi:hypothetical protein
MIEKSTAAIAHTGVPVLEALSNRWEGVEAAA